MEFFTLIVLGCTDSTVDEQLYTKFAPLQMKFHPPPPSLVLILPFLSSSLHFFVILSVKILGLKKTYELIWAQK